MLTMDLEEKMERKIVVAGPVATRPVATAPAHRTRDLGEAAALTCLLRQPPSLEREDSHFLFTFVSPKAAELSRRFWASSLKIDARGFSLALRAIKDLIHRGPSHE